LEFLTLFLLDLVHKKLKVCHHLLLLRRLSVLCHLEDKHTKQLAHVAEVEEEGKGVLIGTMNPLLDRHPADEYKGDEPEGPHTAHQCGNMIGHSIIEMFEHEEEKGRLA